MLSILAWLIGSKAGRIVAVITLGVIGAAFVVWSAFRKGEEAERAKQAQRTLQNIRERIATDEEVGRMSARERRDALARWVRD